MVKNMNIDDAFDLLHDLVDLDKDEINKNFSVENVKLLQILYEDFTNEKCDEINNEAGFFELVNSLDAKEAEYSKALGAAIIKSSNLKEKGNIVEAIKVMNDFIANCKARSYMSIAEIERDNLSDGF